MAMENKELGYQLPFPKSVTIKKNFQFFINKDFLAKLQFRDLLLYSLYHRTCTSKKMDVKMMMMKMMILSD